MKQLTGPNIAGRIVEVQISQRAERFTPRESRTWRTLADKLLAAVAAYDAPVQALYDELEEVALTGGVADEERQASLRQINSAIRELDQTVGEERFTLRLEDSEFAFLDAHWWNCKLPADRKTAVLTEAVSVMIEEAFDVLEVDGVWGKVEPAFCPGSRGEKRRAALGRR